MMENCIFCKISRHQIPAETVYEDRDIIAFHDISPKAKVHLLIIPKEHLASVNDLSEKNNELISKLVLVAKKLAKETGIAKTGYRLSMNTGPHAGQIVPHLHVHLLGGEDLGDIA